MLEVKVDRAMLEIRLKPLGNPPIKTTKGIARSIRKLTGVKKVSSSNGYLLAQVSGIIGEIRSEIEKKPGVRTTIWQ